MMDNEIHDVTFKLALPTGRSPQVFTSVPGGRNVCLKPKVRNKCQNVALRFQTPGSSLSTERRPMYLALEPSYLILSFCFSTSLMTGTTCLRLARSDLTSYFKWFK
ncbi:hypothetical protein FKM82_002911 [Ascaphus truei]